MDLLKLIVPNDTFMCQWTGPAMVHVMASHLFDTMQLPEPMLTNCQLDPQEQINEIQIKMGKFSMKQMNLKMSLLNVPHLSRGPWVSD